MVGNGVDKSSLLLRGENGRGQGGLADRRDSFFDLILRLIIKGHAVEQHAAEGVALDVGGSSIDVGYYTEEHLADHLFLGHIRNIGLSPTVVLGEDAVVVERCSVERQLGGLVGGSRSPCIGGSFFCGSGDLEIVIERISEHARAEQYQYQ